MDAICSLKDACLVDHEGRTVLSGLNLEIRNGESLALIAPVGAGKRFLAAALMGRLAFRSSLPHLVPPPGRCRCISFDEQERVIAAELARDESDFVEGGYHPGTLVADFLGHPALEQRLEEWGLEGRGHRGLKELSSGEFRKVALLEALGSDCQLLVVDDINDSLDPSGRRMVDLVLRSWAGALLYMVEDEEDVPPWIHRCMHLDAGTHPRAAGEDSGAIPAGILAPPPEGTLLLDLQQIRLCYGDQVVLDGLDLCLKSGDHARIRGPNGCGKSSLLKLIHGDHPQAYVNHVVVCGYRRGSGESVWDVKARLGLVSSALQMEWLRYGSMAVIDVVISGLHDSIGLYCRPTDHERILAHEWLLTAGLQGLAGADFAGLSWGQQRVVLLLRAMIKMPWLLLLDEPCQGLDHRSRQMVLRAVDAVARRGGTTVVLVTHDERDSPGCIRKDFHFVRGPEGWRLDQVSSMVSS